MPGLPRAVACPAPDAGAGAAGGLAGVHGWPVALTSFIGRADRSARSRACSGSAGW